MNPKFILFIQLIAIITFSITSIQARTKPEYNGTRFPHYFNDEKINNTEKRIVNPELAVGITDPIVVQFECPNFEKCVRLILEKPTGDITNIDMLTILEMQCRYSGVTSIAGLEYALNLEALLLNSCDQVTSIEPIRELYKLKEVDIFNAPIQDLTPLENLVNIQFLKLQNTEIIDLSFLSKMTDLREIYFFTEKLQDISALRNLQNLREVFIRHSKITDLSPLANKSNLEYLGILNSDVSDLSSLQNLPNIKEINIFYSKVRNLSTLKNLNNLEWLGISGNNLVSLDGLQDLGDNLTHLFADKNELESVKELQNFDKLEYLELSYNRINDLSAIANLTNLKALFVDNNNLDNSDLLSLYNLDKLTRLDIFSNPGITSGRAMEDLGRNLLNLSCYRIHHDLTCGRDPDIAAISNVPENQGTQYQSFIIEATATNQAGIPVQIKANWGDGSSSDFSDFQPNSSTFILSHIYSTEGIYQIRVMARSENGVETAWSKSREIIINGANKAPVVRINRIFPDPALIGQEISVQLTATDGDDDLVKTRVVWGDGETSFFSNFKASGSEYEFLHTYNTPGTYEIKAVGRDEYDLRGLWSDAHQLVVERPNTAPTAAVTSVTPNPAEPSRTVTIEARGTDNEAHQVRLMVDFGDGTTSEFTELQASGSTQSFTHVYQIDGQYEITALAQDEKEAYSDWSAPVSITVATPNSAPVVSNISITPNPAKTGQEVSVQVSVTDNENHNVQAQIDWGNGTVSGFSALENSGSVFNFSNIYPDTGKFEIRIKAKDELGLESAWSEPQSISIISGNTAPSAQIISLIPNPVEAGKPVTAQFSAADHENDQVRIQINWGDGRISDFSEFKASQAVFAYTPVFSQAGAFAVQVIARDEHGLTGSWSIAETLKVVGPNTAPVAAIQNISPNPAKSGTEVKIWVAANDEQNQNVQIQLDFGDGQQSEYSTIIACDSLLGFDHVYNSAGTFQLKARAKDTEDLVGEWSASQILTVNHTNSAPVSTIRSVSPSNPVAGETVTVGVMATDSEDHQVQVRIDWGDGQISDYTELKSSGSLSVFIHMYPSQGDYFLKVQANDELGLEGNWTEPQSIHIEQANSAPTASIQSVSPAQPRAAQPCTLQVLAIDSENQLVQVRVDWGDGKIPNYTELKSSGAITEQSHTYAAKGDYSVKVQARDALSLEGNWSQPQIIKVETANTAPSSSIKSISPNPAETGQQVTVNASANDDQNDRIQMQINWGDGTISEYSALQTNESEFTFTHYYAGAGAYQIQTAAKDEPGLVGAWSENYSITVKEPGTAVNAQDNIVKEFDLMQNFPNPFNNSTTIHYSLKETAEIVMCVFDTNGKRVKTLVSGEQIQGLHQIQWDGNNTAGAPVSSGIYLIRMNAKGRVFSRKVILLK